MRRDYGLLFGPLAATFLYIGDAWQFRRLAPACLPISSGFNRDPAVHARQVHEPPSETDSVP